MDHACPPGRTSAISDLGEDGGFREFLCRISQLLAPNDVKIEGCSQAGCWTSGAGGRAGKACGAGGPGGSRASAGSGSRVMAIDRRALGLCPAGRGGSGRLLLGILAAARGRGMGWTSGGITGMATMWAPCLSPAH